MRLLRPALTFCAAVLLPTPLVAQVAPDDANPELPRVFLDCQANGCDTDFLRTELTWLNFVRDRTLARVHVLATSRGTGSGGTELTVAFIGLGPGRQRADTIVQFSEQSATQAERRALLARVIAQGMIRYAAETPVASRLDIQYRAPAIAMVSETRGAVDRWNLWVFRISGNARFNGEEVYKSSSINGSVRASRITEALKTSLSFNGNYNENHYTLSEGERFASYRHGFSGEALVVQSLTDHWSLGVQANASSSQTSNLDLGVRLGPAIEYDIFPYDQSTRRQVILRYSLGVKLLQYDSLTIYGETSEVRPDHKLVVEAEATQPWGDIGGGAQFSQYLHDPSKYQVNVGVGVSWRVVRGLNFNVNVGYSKIRDQINIKRGNASDEDVFLHLRQLETGYSYYGNVGLSYTFGSIFSNVVNPRFTRNTGDWFF